MRDDQWNSKFPPADEEEELFLRERMERWKDDRRPPFDPYLAPRQYKNKWIAGVLSFMIPGTGQLYLGLMQRGMGIMLLFMLNIFAIVFFATSATSIPLIVLFSLFMPVTYFYNIFDALQQTDRVNGYGGPQFEEHPFSMLKDSTSESGHRPSRFRNRGNSFGYLLIGAGVVLFLVAGKPVWLDRIFEFLGSSVGAVILIVIGLYLFFRESKKK